MESWTIQLRIGGMAAYLPHACLCSFKLEEEELTFKGGTYKRECSKLREKENYMYICLYFEGDILGLWVHLQLLKIQ